MPDEDSQLDPATQAFAVLQGEVASLRQAIQSLEGSRPPDVSPTLGEIAKLQAGVEARLTAIERHPALRLTPAVFQAELGVARRQAEADGARPAQDAQWRLETTTRELAGIVGTAREQNRQNLWLLGAADGGLLVGLAVLAPLLLYALPTGLQTRLVAATMGADRWQAGATMMASASPEAWSDLAGALDLLRLNEAALDACRKTAERTGKEQRCTLTVPAL